MEKQTLFVDVILPLALPKLLSYRVPFELNEYIVPGQRIIVQLGKKKLYTALVRRVHEQAPTGYQAKYIEALLDDKPLVTEGQFRLWEWMSTYYMCSMGEMMAAALPSSLKLASETRVVLNDRWDGPEVDLNDKEFLIYEALQVQEILTIKEISDILQQKTVQPYIKSLIEKGVLTTEEELKQLYRPKIEEYVRLHPDLYDDERLGEVFNRLEKRAAKQLEMLMSFIHLSGNVNHEEREVKKLDLQKSVDAQSSLTKKLVEKEIFEITEKEVGRLEEFDVEHPEAKPFSESQEKAYQELAEIQKEKGTSLLFGVTGSGKTEVYIKLMMDALERGEQVLYLLPEIALTTQIINRLRKHFGDRVGVYHSKFNQNEKVEIWNKVLENKPGDYDIILGARSSIFLPFKKLGLIIVDEEHEPSFKQYDPAPRYNARDMALVMGKLYKASIILGSATPSIESHWHALQGHYHLVELKDRFGGVQMPEIQCADIRKELKRKTMKGIFTSFLLEHIEEVLENGEQVILFQNRRGYSPQWQCRLCGLVPECKSCDVKLTYHKHAHQLKCHYCGYSTNPPTTCSGCGSNDLKMVGFGTEKIEEELEVFFPDARIQRMDLDTTRSKHAYQRIISEFESGQLDILVGTQMVTKGLDFDNVALVGVLNADQMLNFPDFRSFERSYQLMSQVAGRAGRKKKRGKVIVQTYTPDHWVIQRVMQHDYEGLYHQEIMERKNFLYPPFQRLIRLTLKHKDFNIAAQSAYEFTDRLKAKLGNRVLGPETPYISRIKNLYIRNILIKFERESSAASVKKIIQEESLEYFSQPEFKSVRVVLDVDPV